MTCPRLRGALALPALALALPLASCHSTSIDPMEFDYYTSGYSSDYSAPVTAEQRPVGDYQARPASFADRPLIGQPERTTTPDPVATTVTVQKGDTLYAISKRFYGTGGRWREIASLNGIGQADLARLRVGQVLKIPPK